MSNPVMPQEGWPCKLCVSEMCSDPKCRNGWYCQASLCTPTSESPEHARRQGASHYRPHVYVENRFVTPARCRYCSCGPEHENHRVVGERLKAENERIRSAAKLHKCLGRKEGYNAGCPICNALASPTGPDPRQPEMVSRVAVLNHLLALETLAILNGDQSTILALRDAKRKVKSL